MNVILTLINTLLLYNTLSKVVFTEPENKPDHMGLQKQEVFRREELKGTQSANY